MMVGEDTFTCDKTVTFGGTVSFVVTVAFGGTVDFVGQLPLEGQLPMVRRGRLSIVVRGKSPLVGERPVDCDGSVNCCGPVLGSMTAQWRWVSMARISDSSQKENPGSWCVPR